MIRITRFVVKSRLFDLLVMPHVSKIELKSQSNKTLKNPAICKVRIYLISSNKGYEEDQYFQNQLNSIVQWAKLNKNQYAHGMACSAKINGFLIESHFDHFNYPIPEKYRKLCEYYSKEFFDLFNHGKI